MKDRQINIFAEDDRLSKLSSMGDPLEKVAEAINFELFRPVLERVSRKEPVAPGCRPPWDTVMMLKILLLQQWYGIADDRTEYLINDRLSFQRFLELSLGDKVPDAKTIWLFREKLTKSGGYKEAFALFAQLMEEQGVITRKGSIVDASFAEVPRQHNTREENELVKKGKGDQLWEDNIHKCRQKDTDARWTRKNDETHYGYKDHVNVDRDSKMITAYSVTDAAVHDSREIVNLIDEKDTELYADSAYAGEELHAVLLEKNPGLILKIHEKGYRKRPLTEEQKAKNREKSKVRARVEHVFGHMTTSFGGMSIRSVGLSRAKCQISLKNLAYNLQRYEYLTRLKKVPCCVKG